MVSGSKPQIPNETYKSVSPLVTCEKDFYLDLESNTCKACSGAGLNSANCEFCGGKESLNDGSKCVKCKSGFVLDINDTQGCLTEDVCLTDSD